ncbi:MAG: carbohydrate binding domain-containing protein [Chitinophagales bacterium]
MDLIKYNSSKIKNIIQPSLWLLLSLFLVLPFSSCEKDDTDKLTGEIGAANAVDVSSRITGFDSSVTGAGATLSALGSGLSGVKRVFMGSNSSPSVVASESSVTFTVPIGVVLGVQEVTFIFEGNERATASIEVVALPVISYVGPLASYVGDEIIIIGDNLSIVESVLIGDVPASINSSEKDIIAFTVPNGAVSGSVFTLSSPAGVVSSSEVLFLCDDSPEEILCLPALNINGSFEEGDLGDATTVAVPGWGFSGAGSLANVEVVSFRNGSTRGGRQALKIEVLDVGANPWNIEIREESFEVAPATTYLYSIQVKGPAGSRVDFTLGLPDFSELNRSEATLSGDWEEISFEFTTGAEDNMIRTPIHFSRDVNIGGTFYLDDLRIVATN